jgi:hypothetical protein
MFLEYELLAQDEMILTGFERMDLNIHAERDPLSMGFQNSIDDG